MPEGPGARRFAELGRRPVLVVALLGVAFVAFQWWWIDHARFFGAMDTDEGSAIGTSLRFHRALATSPVALVQAALGTGSGPLVPLLSLPFIVVFGRSPTTPIFVQPVLVLLSAIGVAGAVQRIAGRWPAIVAGCCTLAMPALITSSRTNQFSNGVGASMCLAMWALLASDRLRRTWPTVGFGVAVGAMTITRTMSVSFVPALLAAALVVIAGRDPRARRNGGIAVAVGLVVAVPWWWSQWDYVSTYLLSSGYGSRSAFFGEEAIGLRLTSHVGYLLRDFRALLPLGAFVAVLGLLEGAVALRRAPRAWFRRHRPLVAVWTAIAIGTAALLSSSNRGVWFSTPLDSLLVMAVVPTGAVLLRRGAPSRAAAAGATLAAVWVTVVGLQVTRIGVAIGLVALGVTVGVVLAAGTRRAGAVGGLALVLAASALVASMPLVGPSTSFADGSVRAQLAGGLEPYLSTVYEVDARLTTQDLATRRRIAGEWAAAAEALDDRLVEMETTLSPGGDGTLAEVLTGSRGMFEINTVVMARELGPRGLRWMVEPNTFETTDDEILTHLTPTADDGTPRILIVVAGRSSPFPDALGWRRLVRLAEREGWVVDTTIPLPDGGEVAIYTHPDAERPR